MINDGIPSVVETSKNYYTKCQVHLVFQLSNAFLVTVTSTVMMMILVMAGAPVHCISKMYYSRVAFVASWTLAD